MLPAEIKIIKFRIVRVPGQRAEPPFLGVECEGVGCILLQEPKKDAKRGGECGGGSVHRGYLIYSHPSLWEFILGSLASFKQPLPYPKRSGKAFLSF